MTKTWVAWSAAALSLMMSSACSVIDDLGAQCLLVRKDPTDPTGNRSITIKESDIQSYANTDIISFGATECENLVCVRAANTPLTGNPNADVSGFCSRACVENNSTGCITGNGAVDNNDPYACRALALDPDALAAIRQQYPDLIPPGVNSPFYCAKPLVLSTP